MIHFGMVNDQWVTWGSHRPVTTFPAHHHGPPNVPRTIAEVVYKEYAAEYGISQSLDRLGERGGFGWTEMVNLLFSRVVRLEAQADRLEALARALEEARTALKTCKWTPIKQTFELGQVNKALARIEAVLPSQK